MKAVILAGGSGSRLWPLSRKNKPKQFHALINEQTLFQETIARLSFLKKENIYISTNQEYLADIRKQAPEIPLKNIIVEPALRDTSACIGYSAVYIGKRFPKEVMSVIYSDHLIQDKEEFIAKLKTAAEIAKKEKTLNIIEVKAKYPNTNLGYVKIGKILKKVNTFEVHAFQKFIEKPDKKTAKKLITSKNYLWNTGYYVWRIDSILEQYQKYLPETYKNLLKIQQAIGTPAETKILKQIYPKLEKISIDYGIMEKVNPAIVRIIPADLGWSDVGSWETLHEKLTKKKSANLIKGNCLDLHSKGCLIYNYTDSLITTVGLKNLAIIQTPDALLICPKEKSHEIKKIVEELKKQNRDDLL